MRRILLKYPYFAICGFFFYIMFMALFFNVNFSQSRHWKEFDFIFQLVASLVCLLFLLPSIIFSKSPDTQINPVKDKMRFYSRRFISGFFFAWGSCFFNNSIILTKDFIILFKRTVLTWPQLNLLCMLALSLIFLIAYFLPKKIRQNSFLGCIVFLIGFILLFTIKNGESYNYQFVALIILWSHFVLQGLPWVFIQILLFICFWLFTIKINRADLFYFKNSMHLWLNTLLFNCLVSFLMMPMFLRDVSFTDSFSYLFALFKQWQFSVNLTIAFVLFGFFLWIVINSFCYLEALKESDRILDAWMLSVLSIIVYTFVAGLLPATFLLKIFIMALGIFVFGKPSLLQSFKNNSLDRIEKIVLFLLFFLLARLFIWALPLWIRGIFHLLHILKEQIPTLFGNIQFLSVCKYIDDNGIVFSLLLACCLYGCLLYKHSPFKEIITLLLDYFLACIASVVAINLIQSYFFFLLEPPKTTIHLYAVTQIDLVQSTLCLLAIYICFRQGVEIGKRLVLWTILSNLIIYIGLSKAICIVFINLQRELQLVNMDFFKDVWLVLPYIVSLFIFLCSVVICFNKKIDEKVLPTLLQCRSPYISEKQKIEEIKYFLKEKNFLSDTETTQIFISQIVENNAYTIGNKTIAITHLLFQKLTPRQIAGIFSHEFGHLKYNDGRLRVLLYVLNLPITLIRKAFSAFCNHHSIIIETGCIIFFVFLMYKMALLEAGYGILDIAIGLLLQAMVFLVKNQDMQNSEWKADEYAVSNGLGQELKEALLIMASEEDMKEDREPLMEKYPDLAERICRLERLQNTVGA